MALENSQKSNPGYADKDDNLEKKVDNPCNGDLEASKKDNHSRNSHDDKKPNPGGRIAPVLPHLKGYDFSSDESSDILGKQIEMEADSAIQYKTCSWRKVRLFFFLSTNGFLMSFPKFKLASFRLLSAGGDYSLEVSF